MHYIEFILSFTNFKHLPLIFFADPTFYFLFYIKFLFLSFNGIGYINVVNFKMLLMTAIK